MKSRWKMITTNGANLAFQVYLEKGGDDLNKLGLPELKDLVKFIILVDRQGNEVQSNYTNKTKCIDRLERDGKQSWRFWVDPDFFGEEDEGDEETPSAEADADDSLQLAAV